MLFVRLGDALTELIIGRQGGRAIGKDGFGAAAKGVVLELGFTAQGVADEDLATCSVVLEFRAISQGIDDGGFGGRPHHIQSG